jgi:shikimate kinase
MNGKMKNIVLTGFAPRENVGWLDAGRTTQVAFLDTDVLLCQRLGAPIADIVAVMVGLFRQAEGRLLRNWLQWRKRCGHR